MRRALVFDVDNTLTPPRAPIEPTMADALNALTEPFFLAAGSDIGMIEGQIVAPLYERYGFRGSLDMFLCNGSSRYRSTLAGDGFSVVSVSQFSLAEYLGEEELERLKTVLEALLKSNAHLLDDSVHVGKNRLVDRGPMINLTPIGRSLGEVTEAERRNREAFVEFDQRTGYRLDLLDEITRTLAEQGFDEGLFLTLGGQTSFDIVVRGYDKSFAVQTLISEGFTDLVYFGDALHEHGNDAAITRFIEDWSEPGPCPVRAVPVDGWRQTIEELNDLGVVGEGTSVAP